MADLGILLAPAGRPGCSAALRLESGAGPPDLTPARPWRDVRPGDSVRGESGAEYRVEWVGPAELLPAPALPA